MEDAGGEPFMAISGLGTHLWWLLNCAHASDSVKCMLSTSFYTSRTIFFSFSFLKLFFFFFPETSCWKKDFTVQPWPYSFMLLFLQQSFHLTPFITAQRVSFGQLAEEKIKKMVYYCFLTAARKERFWKHASVRYRKIRGLGYNLHAHLVIITF